MSQASDAWWISANVVAVLTALFRAEPQDDWQRRALAAATLPVPSEVLVYGDAICSFCGHEIDSQVCHCGGSEAGHDDHRFVPAGCTCGYYDSESRAVIPPIVPGTLSGFAGPCGFSNGTGCAGMLS